MGAAGRAGGSPAAPAGAAPTGAAPTGAAPSEGGALGAALLVAAAACCFGAISTLAVIATRPQGGRPGPALETVLTWRYLVAGVALAPLAAAARRRARLGAGPAAPPLAPREHAAAVLVGGLGQAAVAFLTISAARFVPVAAVGFLFYTFPAWVVLLAALRGTERVGGAQLGALALALGGIACTVGVPGPGGLAGPGGGPAWPGVLLALAGALAYALYIPYLGRLQARATPAAASAYVCAGAAAVLGAGALARGTFTAALAPAAWGAVAVLALVCTVLAFLAFMRGLGRLGPVRTAIVSTVEPFFTAALGAAALGQPFGPATLAGGALIAAAVLLLQRRAAPRAAPAAAG